MNLSFISKGIVCLLSLGSVAHATVSPDRTRIIFNASAKSVSVKLRVKPIPIWLSHG